MVRHWTTSGAYNMWGRNHFPLILQYFLQTAMVRVWFLAEHLYRKRSSCLFCSHSFHVQESFEHLYWIKCHPCKLFALRHLYATFPMVEHRYFSKYICTSAFKGMTIIWYACPPGDNVWTKCCNDCQYTVSSPFRSGQAPMLKGFEVTFKFINPKLWRHLNFVLSVLMFISWWTEKCV